MEPIPISNLGTGRIRHPGMVGILIRSLGTGLRRRAGMERIPVRVAPRAGMVVSPRQVGMERVELRGWWIPIPVLIKPGTGLNRLAATALTTTSRATLRLRGSSLAMANLDLELLPKDSILGLCGLSLLLPRMRTNMI